MKLGIISDIHGNLPALRMVLDDLPDVDHIVCLGDIVGYYPWPKECLHLTRKRCALVLQGNHDRDVRDPRHRYKYNRQAQKALAYTREHLDEQELDWLNSLPSKADILDTKYLAAHSHPRRLDEYVMPRDFPRMRPFLDNYQGLFLGHTHIQHHAVIDNRWIVNPGSVGQPRDSDPRSAYAIFDTQAQELDLRRVRYDIEGVVKKIKEVGLPTELGERLREGR